MRSMTFIPAVVVLLGCSWAMGQSPSGPNRYRPVTFAPDGQLRWEQQAVQITPAVRQSSYLPPMDSEPPTSRPYLPPDGSMTYSPVGASNLPSTLPPAGCTACGPALSAPAVVEPFPPAPIAVGPPRSVTMFRPIVPLTSMPAETYAGQGIIGQPKLYVPGQPVRNFFRWISP